MTYKITEQSYKKLRSYQKINKNIFDKLYETDEILFYVNDIESFNNIFKLLTPIISQNNKVFYNPKSEIVKFILSFIGFESLMYITEYTEISCNGYHIYYTDPESEYFIHIAIGTHDAATYVFDFIMTITKPSYLLSV
jgi:hypothetical protein